MPIEMSMYKTLFYMSARHDNIDITTTVSVTVYSYLTTNWEAKSDESITKLGFIVYTLFCNVNAFLVGFALLDL